jgi:hypothetical protein
MVPRHRTSNIEVKISFAYFVMFIVKFSPLEDAKQYRDLVETDGVQNQGC